MPRRPEPVKKDGEGMTDGSFGSRMEANPGLMFCRMCMLRHGV